MSALFLDVSGFKQASCFGRRNVSGAHLFFWKQIDIEWNCAWVQLPPGSCLDVDGHIVPARGRISLDCVAG